MVSNNGRLLLDRGRQLKRTDSLAHLSSALTASSMVIRPRIDHFFPAASNHSEPRPEYDDLTIDPHPSFTCNGAVKNLTYREPVKPRSKKSSYGERIAICGTLKAEPPFQVPKDDS